MPNQMIGLARLDSGPECDWSWRCSGPSEWYADDEGLSLALESSTKLKLQITHTIHMRGRGLCLVRTAFCWIHVYLHIRIQLCCGVHRSHTLNPLNTYTVCIPDRPRPVKEICFSLVVWRGFPGLAA